MTEQQEITLLSYLKKHSVQNPYGYYIFKDDDLVKIFREVRDIIKEL